MPELHPRATEPAELVRTGTREDLERARAGAANPMMAHLMQDLQQEAPHHEVNVLRQQVAALQSEVKYLRESYYASSDAVTDDPHHIPKGGRPAGFALEAIKTACSLDNNPRLNTSSYVNVVFEPEEEEAALLGLKVNIADQSVYRESFRLHNKVLNMVAHLWHCPKDEEFAEYGCFPGAGTVGSTEACLLAGDRVT